MNFWKNLHYTGCFFLQNTEKLILGRLGIHSSKTVLLEWAGSGAWIHKEWKRMLVNCEYFGLTDRQPTPPFEILDDCYQKF